jgi:hypothetical protein
MRENALIVTSLLTRSRDPSPLVRYPSVYRCCLATKEARRWTTRHGENTASSTVAWERVSMLQFLHGVKTPQYIYGRVNIWKEDFMTELKIRTISKKMNTGKFQWTIWIDWQMKITRQTKGRRTRGSYWNSRNDDVTMEQVCWPIPRS